MAGSIQLENSNYTINEDGNGFVSVRILRSGSLEGAVTVGYATIGNTAETGADFASVAGTVIFAPGETSKTIDIQIFDDAVAEGTEHFSFVIDSVENGSLTVPRTADISILDDEAPTTGGDPDETPTYPLNVEAVTYVDGLVTPMTMQFLPGGPDDPEFMLVADKRGRVLSVRDGELQGAILDIQDQVNSIGDRGLMDIELDPNFPDNPYLYAVYVYDPPETRDALAGSRAAPDALGNRPARVSRFEVTFDADGNPRIDRGSEKILVGAAGIWENISGPDVDSTTDFDQPPSGIDPVTGENIDDYIAVDSGTHAPGDIEFGPDGALYVSIGDGTSYNAVDIRALRVQDVNNLSGKVLRVDPETGRGLADNPFYNGDPDSNASKVYQMGLRNGFRMDFDPTTGQLYVGDVGWTLWEQIETGGPGANFGWPYYEGGDGELAPQPLYSSLAEAQAFYAAVARGDIVVNVPIRAFSHDRAVEGPDMRAIILGPVYNGTAYPEILQGDLIFGDIAGNVYAMDVNDPARTVRLLLEGGSYSDYVIGPDGKIYVSDFYGGGAIRRLEISSLDTITGTQGADTLRGTSRNEVLLGYGGDDALFGAGGDDRLEGGPGNDRLEGGAGNDALYGGAGNDTLIGGAGNDTLYGDSGANLLNGGSGDDTYVLEAAGSTVTEYANGGLDAVQSTVSHTLTANVENLTLTGAAGTSGLGNELANVITGNSGANLLRGGTGDDTLYGGGGNDSLYGDAGADRLEGGVGDDRLEGAAGNDILYGGAGNDTIHGGAGNDALYDDVGTLYGGSGDDAYFLTGVGATVVEYANGGLDAVQSTVSHTLTANVENLTLTGAAISGIGNEIANVITGNGAANVLLGGGGNDALYGGGGGDRLEGGAGDDRIEGGAGDDVLYGGIGADVLLGGAGNDTIYGDTGQDSLSGGSGADVFIFDGIAHAGLGATRDVITDFLAGADRIDLRAMDANVGAAGDQAFAFIGGAAFAAGGAGELRFAGGILSGDVNGDRVAEFEIALTGVATLSASSFLL